MIYFFLLFYLKVVSKDVSDMYIYVCLYASFRFLISLMKSLLSILCKTSVFFCCASITQAGGMNFHSLLDEGISVGEGVVSNIATLSGLKELTNLADDTTYLNHLTGLAQATGLTEALSSLGSLTGLESQVTGFISELSTVMGTNSIPITEIGALTGLESALTGTLGGTGSADDATKSAYMDGANSQINSVINLGTTLPGILPSSLSARLIELRSELSELAKLSALANMQSAVSEFEVHSHTFSAALTQALTKATEIGKTMESVLPVTTGGMFGGSISNEVTDSTILGSTFSATTEYTAPSLNHQIGNIGDIITIDGHMYTLGSVISGGQVVHGGAVTALDNSQEVFSQDPTSYITSQIPQGNILTTTSLDVSTNEQSMAQSAFMSTIY